MRRLYSLLFVIVALMMPIDTWAALTVTDNFTVDGILYTVITKQGEVQVGYYDETNNDYLPSIDKTTEGVLEIPAVVTGSDGKSYSVTRIGKSAFEGCQALSTVTLPNSITSIGKFAFKGCIGLTSLTIPNSVKDIEHFAFTGCSNLVTIDIPASVTSIGQSVFRNCTSLVSVSIPNSVLSIGYAIFDGCKSLSTVMSYIETPFAIELPGETARMLYEMNTTLYVPAGTKALYEATDGWKEFKNIVEMESENKDLKVGDTFTTDGISYHVTNIAPLEVQVGIYHTSDTIITAVPQDTIGAIVIPSSVTAKDGNLYYVTSIGYQAFRGCINITSLSMPETITEIEPQSFVMCVNLSSINIPSSVKTIGYNAFMNCSKLQSVSLPNSITSIGFGAFGWCPNLLEVYSYIENPFAINNGGMGDAYNPFDFYREGLTLYIPVGTKALYEATDGWKEFKNIVEMESENKDLKVGDTFTSDGITYQVTSIDPMEVQVGDGKHSVIDDVTPMDVDIPSTVTGPDSNVYTVTSIAKLAFFDCNEVTSIKLPSTIVSIGDQSFQACWKVPSITIPKSVTYIGFRAFAECSKLTEIYSQIEEPFALADEAFRYKYINAETYYNRVTLYVPVGTKEKYEATDGWKEFKNIVEMTPYDVLDDNTVAAHFLQPDEEGKVEIPATVEIDGKTYTVTEIAAGAFKDNKELKEVTIPGTVTKIGDGAFAGCENLRAIYVFAPEPISLTAAEPRNMVTRAADNVPSQFEGIDFDACTLYVPIGSEQKYREAEGWKLFTNIVGVADPSGITTVLTETKSNAAVYNLSGQRLTAPQKGLNIIGGKKVVVR